MTTLARSATRLAQPDSVGGIYAVTLGLFMFSIQDVIIRSFSDTYSILQIVFIRSVTAILIMVSVVALTAGRDAFGIHRFWPVFIKGSCGFFSYLAYYMALTGLPLADAATITFSAPIMVTALSAVLFGERVGWRRWSAVLLGFFAIVLVVGPKGHFNNLAVVFALTAAFTYAVSTLTTRFIHPEDSALTASLYSLGTFLFWSIVSSAVVLALFESDESAPASIAFLLRRWHDPTTLDLWLMVLLGFISAGGFYCLVRAYMVAEFSAVAPFEYTYILWGALFGFLIWNEVPSTATLAGISLLVGSNLYILRRELAARRRTAYRKPRIPHR